MASRRAAASHDCGRYRDPGTKMRRETSREAFAVCTLTSSTNSRSRPESRSLTERARTARCRSPRSWLPTFAMCVFCASMRTGAPRPGRGAADQRRRRRRRDGGRSDVGPLRTGLLTLGVCFQGGQCRIRALRADVARRILPTVGNRDWLFDTELLVRAERARLRIHELRLG